MLRLLLGISASQTCTDLRDAGTRGHSKRACWAAQTALTRLGPRRMRPLRQAPQHSPPHEILTAPPPAPLRRRRAPATVGIG